MSDGLLGESNDNFKKTITDPALLGGFERRGLRRLVKLLVPHGAKRSDVVGNLGCDRRGRVC